MEGANLAVVISLLPRLPLLIAYLAGLALAASYARQLGNAALMAGIGFGLLTLSWLIGAGSQYWMFTMPRETLRASMGMVATLGWLREGTAVAGTAFLLIAIFARRSAPAQKAG